MNGSAKYWHICRLSLTCNRGYEFKEIIAAKNFYQELNDVEATEILLTFFDSDSPLAGLCLRCYVSYPILKACQKLANLFSSNYNFNYIDLLPFVLNDDGKQQVILAQDKKIQLIIDQNGKTKPTQYRLFTVEVVATYNFGDSLSMSLDNWAFLQTKQHPELKKFLAEFGFRHLSDWAMLNRVGVKQLSQLAPSDRYLVEVFHEVYRRDRRKKANRMGKCPNPTENQLTKMQTLLHSRNYLFPSTDSIFTALKKVASQIRQYDIWSYREPLEVYEPDSGNYSPRTDLPSDNSNDAVISEEQELLNFIRDSLNQTLENAIALASENRIAKLNKSKKYRPFANKFVAGLELYYAQKMSLKEIVPVLGFNGWDQARRVLNPGDFLNAVRIQTIQQLLDIILQKTKELGLSDTAINPNYLQNLSIQIEAFADEMVFNTATSEIKAGKNRDFQSLYAQQVRLYCQNQPN